MSLLNRQPRPIPSRDKDPASLRDDRLFIIACDDTYAPQQYFGFFRMTRDTIPKPDGLRGPVHHPAPNQNRTEIERCLALFECRPKPVRDSARTARLALLALG
jgi:hypothetical protein